METLFKVLLYSPNGPGTPDCPPQPPRFTDLQIADLPHLSVIQSLPGALDSKSDRLVQVLLASGGKEMDLESKGPKVPFLAQGQLRALA